VKANLGRTSWNVLTKHAVLLVGGFKLAPRPRIFAILNQILKLCIHNMDVPLTRCELTAVLKCRLA